MEKSTAYSIEYQHFAEQLQYVRGYAFCAQIIRKLVITPFCIDNELEITACYSKTLPNSRLILSHFV